MINNLKPAIYNLSRMIVGVSCVLFLPASYAASSCPAINCDCPSLPNESWQLVCSVHEGKIKDACVKNGNQPTDFCAIHGPSARPLPLVLELGDVTLLPEDEIKQVHKQAATMYWSIHTDMETAATLAKEGKYGESIGTLKIVDRNLDTLFTMQRQVTISHEVNEDTGRAISAWKDYSGDTLKEAENMFKIGKMMWDQKDEGDVKHKKAYPILSTKVLRMASKAYEMAAYAYSGAKKDDDAAKVWRDASDVSKVIMDHKIAEKAQSAHIDYYRKQAAMRLHRASYHWMMDNEEEDAKVSLQASVEYMENKNALSDLLKEPGEEESIPDEKVANSPY